MSIKYLICLLSLLAIFSLQSCSYYHVQQPLDTNFEETNLGTKVGVAHSRSILWLFSWGDRGSKAAAENGNITIINHADMDIKIVLFGLYTRVTTVVYGD